MSTKTLSATCDDAGKVTAEGSVIPGASVLTHGKQASSGLALIEKDKVTYITANTDDLKTAIDKIAQALSDAADGLNAAGSALNSLAPGSGASVISAANEITPIVSDLNDLKEALK